MWIVRELLRLLARVVVGVAIAALVGGLWALTQPGGAHHRFQISFLVVGALVLLLGAVGRGSNYERYAGLEARFRYPPLSGLFPPGAASEPRLAPGAVLFLTGAIVIALGFLI